jgi:hypothetical protein
MGDREASSWGTPGNKPREIIRDPYGKQAAVE